MLNFSLYYRKINKFKLAYQYSFTLSKLADYLITSCTVINSIFFFLIRILKLKIKLILKKVKN